MASWLTATLIFPFEAGANTQRNHGIAFANNREGGWSAKPTILFFGFATKTCSSESAYPTSQRRQTLRWRRLRAVARRKAAAPQVVLQRNPWVMRDMAERCLEAATRGLWSDADALLLDEIRRALLESERAVEAGNFCA